MARSRGDAAIRCGLGAPSGGSPRPGTSAWDVARGSGAGAPGAFKLETLPGHPATRSIRAPAGVPDCCINKGPLFLSVEPEADFAKARHSRVWLILTGGELEPHAASAGNRRILCSGRVYGQRFYATNRCTLGAREDCREETSLLIGNAAVLVADAGNRMVEDGAVYVEAGRIAAVGPGAEVGPGARLRAPPATAASSTGAGRGRRPAFRAHNRGMSAWRKRGRGP